MATKYSEMTEREQGYAEGRRRVLIDMAYRFARELAGEKQGDV